MKAFLLAAGHGTRLRPLTDRLPKCLLPIQGMPMLEIWLEQCALLGIDEVLINIHSHANLVREFVAGHRGTTRVHVVEEKNLLGSAGTLRANADWVSREPYFWIFYGDVLTNADLSQMLDTHLVKAQAATLGLYQVLDPKRCGVVTLDENDIVTQFVEKPTRPASDLAFAGLMVATPELLWAIPPRDPCDIGFDLLPRLSGRMAGYRISEYLIDIGTPNNYTHAQQTWPGLHRMRRDHEACYEQR